MDYWIKSAGTADDPVPANWYSWGRNSLGGFGDPTMFSRRPAVRQDDRLVFYAVGSAARFKLLIFGCRTLARRGRSLNGGCPQEGGSRCSGKLPLPGFLEDLLLAADDLDALKALDLELDL